VNKEQMMPKPKSPVVKIVTATEAQNKFGAMLKRAYQSAEHLIIERESIPVAALIPIADYQRLLVDAPASEFSQRIAIAGQRDKALRELQTFLEGVHHKMPAVNENEAERLINEATRDVRQSHARRPNKRK